MNEPVWITGPALEILLQSNAIRAGDRILAVPRGGVGTWTKPEDVRIRVVCDDSFITNCHCDNGTCTAAVTITKTLEEIKAWRRP